jgi:hypothetical protein
MLLGKLKGHNKENAEGHESIFPDNIPLEFQVLLSACRVFLGTEEPARLETLLAQGPDWDKLLALANRHGVMPLLYHSISQSCPQAVPQEWLARLRLKYMQNAARNLRMTLELLRILDVLKEAGIRALPLKGPVLAETVYGDIALRQFTDLDVLVAPDDLQKALHVMAAQGYRCLEDLSERKRASFLGMMHHYHLSHEKSATTVELHWKSSPSIYSLQMDTAAMLRRAEKGEVLGREIMILSREDELMLLCLHGVKHTWKKLSWICDLAGFTAADRVEWTRSLEAAREERMEKVILLGASLAEDVLGIKIPEEISERIKGQTKLLKANRDIINNYILEKDASSRDVVINEELGYLNVLDNRRDKARFLLRLALHPVNEDFEALRMPDMLFPAYYLIRPARLISTYGKALWRHLLNRKRPEDS